MSLDSVLTGVAIKAAGLGLQTPRGWVYRDVSFEVPDGSLALIVGSEGSGKTTLLLTIASRIKPTAGSLTVAGVDASRRRQAARSRVGLGLFANVNEFDATLTVHQQVMAELALHGMRWRHARVHKVLEPLGHEIDENTIVAELSTPDRLLLGAALALVSEPPVIVLDRVDDDLDPAEQSYVLERLRGLTSRGTTVLAGAIDPSLERFADIAYDMPQTEADAGLNLPHAGAEAGLGAPAGVLATTPVGALADTAAGTLVNSPVDGRLDTPAGALPDSASPARVVARAEGSTNAVA